MKALYNNYLLSALLVPLFIACEKNDPITELGDSNGQFSAMLTVSYSNNRPAINDTVTVTASTWQRDDKIAKIEMTETLVENFGLNFTLSKGTNIVTFDSEKSLSLLQLTDTIANNKPWFVINNDAKQLDDYFVTTTNNYVIRAKYPFVITDGKYVNDATIINALSDDEFNVIKSILAYQISQADYKVLFPTAGNDHLSSGTYALSTIGINNLKSNLTKTLLIENITSLKKVGTYSAQIYTNVITPTGAVKSSNNTFQATL